MASQYESDKGPFYRHLTAPFRLNQDDGLSELAINEFPTITGFTEYGKKLCQILYTSIGTVSGGAHMLMSFALPDAGQPNVVFADNGKMYYMTTGGVLTEITVAGGSTAITADAANNNLYSIAFVNGSLYFAHDGTGPLRVWAGGATYADVAAPGSGYHNGVKYKPYYLTAQNNRLIILGDAAAVVGTQYDVVGSTVTSAVDFTSFGSFYVQLLDTTDVISGGSVLAGKLVVYKHDSIIIGSPSGDASTPYNFERYQQSTEQGIGVLAPYTIANDGGFTDIFLSRYGMMRFDGTSISPVGMGIDNTLQLGVTATGNKCAMAVMGSFYSTNTYPASASRYYCLADRHNIGANIYIMNVSTGAWNRQRYGSGSSFPFFGLGTGLVGLNSKSILVSVSNTSSDSLILALSVLATSASIGVLGTNFQIDIPPSFAIYGNDQSRTKTVQGIGITFELKGGSVEPADYQIVIEVDNENGAGTPSTLTMLATAASVVTNTPMFYWASISSSGRSPRILIQFATPDGSTVYSWPQISSLTVKYQLGDDV